MQNQYSYVGLLLRDFSQKSNSHLHGTCKNLLQVSKPRLKVRNEKKNQKKNRVAALK